MRRLNLTCLGLFMVCWLTGCGWRLQPDAQLAARLAPVYLQLDDEHSEFARALTARLHAAKVEFAPDASTAKLVLTVMHEEVGHHVSAVSALNEPQQYDVFYEVTWHLNDPDGNTDPAMLEPVTTHISRSMNVDKTLALGLQRQEQLLQKRLAADLANQVINRLGFWPGH